MKIGIPKEIKPQEGRVSMLPKQVKQLVDAGNDVYVEKNAGILSGATDEEYKNAGAKILETAEEIYKSSKLIIKVKEILPKEYDLLKQEHIIFTNIHSALEKEQTDILLEKKLCAIAAEETHQFGSPNCTLAGEVGAFEGVRLCLSPYGGAGVSFMSHFGARKLKTVVMGLGHVGKGALRTLLGLGCEVVGLDINEGAIKESKLNWHDKSFSADRIENLEKYIYEADLIINCVKWAKERKDHLISKDMVKKLKKTCAIIDISCDTNGAVETCVPTKWENPIYETFGIRHYCVDNIPGAVPITASMGYAEALLPKALNIAKYGAIKACKQDEWLKKGLTCDNGNLILKETGIYQNRKYIPVDDYLSENR